MFRVETEDERIVAVMHDVVEDHGHIWPMERLRKEGFPTRILNALDCVTKRDGEAYEQFIERAASDPIALHVKIADIEDNLDVRRLHELNDKNRERLNRYLAAYRRLSQQ